MDRFGEQLNAILMHTYRAVSEVESAALRSTMGGNLSISEMHVIECIGQGRENGRTVTDIAQELGVALASATVSIMKLEKKGYVSKEKCAEDGRRVLVRLTESGRRAEISHRYFHRQMAHAVERAIPAEERAVVLSGFRTIDEFFTRKAVELDGEEAPVEAKGDRGE